ncbi:hypothetical protein [Sphingobacterium pedocola]|nr:hypothetical protein [Sphingobacterium pedocola]
MKRFYILFSMLVSFATYAQLDTPAAYQVYEGYNLWNKQKGDTAYVFADVAYIRDYPDTDGNLLDSLTHGTMLLITSDGYNERTIRGYEAPWHEVQYEKNGHIKKGFIWLGLLALGRQIDDQGNQFIHGLLRYEKPSEYGGNAYICEVKYLTPDNKLMGRSHYPVYRNGQTYTESKLLPDMGLEGLRYIHRVGFYGEACGIPTTHYYLGWNGENFVDMFSKSSVSDAGVSYYEEKILFPIEHHLEAGLIIKDIVQGEIIDYEAEELQYSETKHRQNYSWDGKRIRLKE